MRIVDFIFDVIIDENDNVHFNSNIIKSNINPISNKKPQIRKYFENTEVTRIFTVDVCTQNTHYIVGFDPTISYFYLFNCHTLEVDLFISKEDRQDSSYLCLVNPILRKEINFVS